ncbi:MAG: hypothetical protein WEA59_01905 [Ferruginibacter sp.]
MALPLLKLVRVSEKFLYTRAELLQFEVGTLGKELVEFVEHKDLQLLPYYARHDLKPLLLNYDTTDEGEICLQCFMLGNRHFSFPVLATVVFGLATMPEHCIKFKQLYQKGQGANALEHWDWFGMLGQPTTHLKSAIFHSKNKSS